MIYGSASIRDFNTAPQAELDHGLLPMLRCSLLRRTAPQINNINENDCIKATDRKENADRGGSSKDVTQFLPSFPLFFL